MRICEVWVLLLLGCLIVGGEEVIDGFDFQDADALECFGRERNGGSCHVDGCSGLVVLRVCSRSRGVVSLCNSHARDSGRWCWP